MSDSDSDAPEAIALSQLARAVRRHEQAVQDFITAEKRKMKDHNRIRDERLKAQAAERQEKKQSVAKRRRLKVTDEVEGNNSQDEETRRLQARMQKAMAEASDEDATDGEEVEDYTGMGEDGFEEEDAPSDEESTAEGVVDEGASRNGDEDDVSDEAETITEPASPRNYLPDHVFAAAAASSKGPQKAQKIISESSMHARKKRKRIAGEAGDIVVGSHAVRTLPTVYRTSAKASLLYTPAIGATTTPARINRFMSKSLALKGQKKRAGQGWERKPVSLGLLKRSEGAPVTGFVREQ